MNNTDQRSIDDVQREADYHRQNLSQKLDMLGERLNHTVSSAEQAREKVKARMDEVENKLHRPVDWARERPLAAFGLAILAGFLFAGKSAYKEPRSARKYRLNREDLEKAYLKGRYDERNELKRSDLKKLRRGAQVPEHYASRRNGVFGFLRPLMIGIATGWAGWTSSRGYSWRNRD